MPAEADTSTPACLTHVAVLDLDGTDDAGVSGDPQRPDTSAWHGRYLRWLLALPPAPARPGPPPVRVLQAIDAVLASPEACNRLIRRAPNVIPKLINTLRADGYSRHEVAAQIERDVVLTAEVLRLVRSGWFCHHVRRSPTVAQAIDLLGTAGLKQVIARVLARPLFEADPGTPQARAAPRIWEESERCARLCAALGAVRGVDVLDAYLAGLLHNVGWSALLKAAGQGGVGAGLHAGWIDEAWAVQALFERRDRFVARMLPPWDISASLNALAPALDGGPAGPAAQALAGVLLDAHALVVLRRLQVRGDWPGGVAAPPQWPPSVQQAYLAA